MTLGEDYPKEQARVRALLIEYESIGPAGAFGKVILNDILKRADEAAISGDLGAMIRSYQEMKGCQ